MTASPRRLWTLVLFFFGLIAVGFYFLREPVTPQPGPGPNQPIGPGFKDVALESGLNFRMAFLPNEQGEKFKINLYDHGCGLAVADFDGDGFEDVYFTNQLGPNALYKNRGDGTFVEVSKEAGVALGDRICVGATWADYDNDGDPDLYVTSTRGGNVLFKNLGQGRFQDVTKEAGVTLVAHCQTAAFFDFDNDGFLDLFVTCTAQWTTDQFDRVSKYYPGLATLPELATCAKEHNVFYRNNGNGTFSDITAQAGLKGQGWGGDVAVFDYDEDGHLDLLVTNMFGASQLYRNQGDGKFSDVTDDTLGRTSWGAIGCKAFDFNNDGRLDVLIVDMHSDMWLPYPTPQPVMAFIAENEKVKYPRVSGPPAKARSEEVEKLFADQFQIKYEQVLFGNTLFKNVGRKKFVEISDQADAETFWPWGIATGDFDNDGYEDVFLPSGMGYPFRYWANRLLMNRGNESFAEKSSAEGIEPPARGRFLEERIGGEEAARSSRCAVAADFRGIGRLDILVNNFNDHPYYFQNQFPQKNYVAFRLQGTKSNRDAIGALVHLYVGKEVLVRQVHCAGGYLSQSSRILHFGLGGRNQIDRVEIRWPSGVRQTIVRPAINERHDVIEPTT